MFGNEVAAVQPGEVAARLAEGWTLLDVRTEDEWAGAASRAQCISRWTS